jgi:hypothetical protein
MIITFTKASASLVLVLALAAGAGCARSSDQASSPPAVDAATATRQAAGDLLGVLKLIRQEYPNAVAPSGATVIDATEYSETELFGEQAGVKLAALRAAGGLGDAGRAARLAAAVTTIRDGVGQKVPPATVVDAAAAAIAIVEESLAGAVPESIRGAVLATTRADQAIGAEEVVGDYRIGVVSGPARQIFRRDDGTLHAEPVAAADTVYVAAVVRERRTKRSLPAAGVSVTIAGQDKRVESRLSELWGDFPQYGGNVGLPGDGPVTITVQVSAPAYARHGDMLNVFVTPATATLKGQVRGGALVFDARPVTATDADYAVGDDLLQAIAEAGALRNAGSYRVGFIVEGPEPIWLWQDGKPVLQPVAATATNHVEVVLIDGDTGQLVPSAGVDVTFLAAGREVGTASLHPLLSIFSHYGETLTLPPGTNAVRVKVTPPAFGALDRPRLADSVALELPLPARRAEGT